jgi:hypothetical protein
MNLWTEITSLMKANHTSRLISPLKSTNSNVHSSDLLAVN